MMCVCAVHVYIIYIHSQWRRPGIRLRRQRYGGLFVCCIRQREEKKRGVGEEGYNTHNARGVIRSGHHE